MGGGNGSAKSIRACKIVDGIDLSAIISVSDSGGSSGLLRTQFNTLPPGDLLRAILAMSPFDYELLKSIFYKPRFNVEGKLQNHNIGNIFLVLSQAYCGDMVAAIRSFEQALGAVGNVYPATLNLTTLVAEMSDYSIIKGEHELDRPTFERSKRIQKVWLEPEGHVYEDAANVIESADYIVIGPGSLYCSIVATLLPKGCREAIERSKAKIIYVVGNAYEEEGETGPTRLSEFVKELQTYLPRKIDSVVYNNRKLSAGQETWYKEKKWKLFEADVENVSEYTIVQGDYERDDRAGLDDEKLGALLKKILI